VLWVVLSVARRLRAKRTAIVPVAARPSLQEFFEAGDYRTPRALRLVQNTPRLPLAEITFDPGAPASVAGRVHPFPAAKTISLFGVQMDALPPGSQTSSTSERSSVSPLASQPRLASVHRFPKLSSNPLQPMAVPGIRKSPQPDRSAEVRRLDLSKYGEQTGDLTDPYTRSLNSAVRGKWSRGI
jgi:hypothetical protein